MDGVINQATKYWYLSNEQGSVPLVVLSVIGAGGRFGAIHSQTPIGWFHSVPGLKIACPSTPSDAKSLLKQAIRDDNPVLFLEHKRLLGLKGEIDEDPLPFGKARVARAGSDLTIVSVMKGVHDSLAAAEELAGEGIDCEVIDLRTIKPLDIETVIASVERTTRLLVVEEGPLTGGWAGEVMARVTEQALGSLDDAWRLATADTPIPYSPPLEDAFLPGAGAIIQSVKERSA
jgi:pyruvate/2-oxoglutarate/acetoin dehydrogenase E1 component